MPKRITVAEHTNIAELEQLYKQGTGGVESRKARCLEASTRQTLRLITLKLKPVSSQNHTWKISGATSPALK